jgi:proteasome lid subunit RPN8/RPN11
MEAETSAEEAVTLDSCTAMVEAIAPRVRDTAPMILPLLVSDLPNEGVGFVWLQGISHVRNQAQSPHRFSFSPTRLSELISENHDVDPQYMYHSHPSGQLNLSSDDWMALRHNWHEGFRVPWVVFPMRAGRDSYDDWKLGKVADTRVGIYTPEHYRTIVLK